jgi:2,4-dichlorophenol 6-monooxygenase
MVSNMGRQKGVHVSAEEQTDVIIVGGGPVGLTASLLLSQLGATHVLHERHQGTSVYPRAVSLNQRTMEVYRSLGLHDELAARAAPQFCHELPAWYTSLTGPTPLHGRLLGSRNAWGGGEYEVEYAAASHVPTVSLRRSGLSRCCARAPRPLPTQVCSSEPRSSK